MSTTDRAKQRALDRLREHARKRTMRDLPHLTPAQVEYLRQNPSEMERVQREVGDPDLLTAMMKGGNDGLSTG